MPKVFTEACTICPELAVAIKIIDTLAYTRRYGEVFEDLMNWLVWQHTFPPDENDPFAKKYKHKEQEAFLEIFKNIQTEVKNRVNL